MKINGNGEILRDSGVVSFILSFLSSVDSEKKNGAYLLMDLSKTTSF